MKESGLNTNEDKTPLRLRVLRKLKRIAMLRIPVGVVNKRKVAVILVSYNRSTRNLENGLLTLRHQTLPASQIDITICDWGSDEANVRALRGMCAKYNVRLILAPPLSSAFNKSRAVNVALWHTPDDADFVLQTDVDMIFAPNFVEMLVRAGVQFYPSLVLCSAQEISQADAIVAEQRDPTSEYKSILSLATLRAGVGMCMCAPRQWFFRIHGYDERYVLWGHEDDDILKRAKLDGLSQVGISDRTSLIHQWHIPATVNAASLTDEERGRRGEALASNRILYMNSMDVIRNPGGWGQEPAGTKVISPPSCSGESKEGIN